MERGYRRLSYFFLLLIPIFVAGFWIPYFSEIPKFDPSITLVDHVHAILLFSFLALLIFQPFAVRRDAFEIHRALGRVSYFLVPAVVLSAIAVVWKEYEANVEQGANAVTARNAEFLSVAQLTLLVVLYCLAVFSIHRRNVPAHMRSIVCIVLVLLPAGLARTFGYWFGLRQSLSQTICLTLIDLVLISLILMDRFRNRPSFPYIVVLASYAAIEAVWFTLGRPT